MKKMSKIMAMLLVIATVIFAAGCAEKTDEGATEGAVDETPVADNGTEPVGEAVNEEPVDDDDADDDNETADDDNATAEDDDADDDDDDNKTA